jgi:hypothetical protein
MPVHPVYGRSWEKTSADAYRREELMQEADGSKELQEA